MNSSLLDRFCRYARIDTTANPKATTYPSSPGQLVLGRLLRDELLAFGLGDAVQDEYGYVFATVPGNVPGAPTICFNAHVDTSPDASGTNVSPQVHKNYDGKDIVLPADPTQVIRVADSPELAKLAGKTIVTTDGTTLLGGDDKAGVSVIMELVRTLTQNPDIQHGPIRVVFTCDEEIGKGVLHLNPADIGAVVGYTLDGSGCAEIEAETFSADKATVTITGVVIHPAIAKGRMVNAVKLAGQFLDRLPKGKLSPETTDGRDGFVHPYTVSGTTAKVVIEFLLRDFETANLTAHADVLRTIAADLAAENPAATFDVSVTEQYRNMRDGIAKEPRAMAFAEQAVRRAGFSPTVKIIRGGTDGALLTAKGLPCPNLSTGEHNFHSPLEWVCVEEMDDCVRVLVELVQVWAGIEASRER